MFKIKPWLSITLLVAALFQINAYAQSPRLDVELTLTDLSVQPYHRPYVAVWLETPDRKHVTTLALWVQKAEWFKDLRQWWRKAGKTDINFDGISGATKRAGTYTINGYTVTNAGYQNQNSRWGGGGSNGPEPSGSTSGASGGIVIGY